ncbi:MAG: hypothetical protein P4L57_01095 [Rhizomicrobium sp.]|nr:hypothetical protein [Rhizomicrobium sp.]
MTAMLPPLVKDLVLDPSQDFYTLRRKGIGFIQNAGSDQWTDYNIHDPGITILEALCFAITDLGYRTGWKIQDILMPKTPSADPNQPYPNQTFFTARQILTVNPTTPNDFRRVLIDLPAVRDAWIIPKQCACGVSYWAYCDLTDQLVLRYGEPVSPPNPANEVWALGLYDVLLELEEDPALGDLNDRMIAYNATYYDTDGAHPIIMELRFPDVSLLEREQWKLFLRSDAVFADASAFTIDLTRLGATKTYDLFSLATADLQNAYIRTQWGNIFYLSFKITVKSSGETIAIENAALRVFADTAVRNAVSAEAWRTLFTGTDGNSFIVRYHAKAKATHIAVASAKTALQQYRNLDEDYCLITCVGIEDVAVCADIEVRPDADIEQVQAEIWFAIEQYMSPPIPFRTLQELQSQNVPVEQIFEGPELANGFIQDADLDTAKLKAMLYGSEIINLLMAIDGVIAVNQLRMTKYDSEGNAVAGAADPSWVTGQPVYDPTKISAAWQLAISPRHQPRLYLNQSRFLFYKSGLPFLPLTDEATDALNQLRGEAERLKNPTAAKDLPVPSGLYRNPDDYYPVQYGFPLTYGIGPDGLPSNALPLRRAQAKDLKAYLMVFEQLLGNALAQLAHTADLFSLDPDVAHTYFVKAFNGATLHGFAEIADVTKLTPGAVQALLESISEFQTRRNTFLDHLLARFGEDFNEYALLLTNAAGTAVAQPRLIESKIAFLKRYPALSHDRAKAFNYKVLPNAPGNDPGIKRRISLLLGYPDLTFVWIVGALNAGKYPVNYSLVDGSGKHWVDGSVTVAAASKALAEQAAYQVLTDRMILSDAYTVAAGPGSAFTLVLNDASAVEIGHSQQSFATQTDALATRDALLGWSANDRMIVVEHLLLRPKFIGDALYPVCCDGGCCACADPYSFRLTFVMPGWTEQYTDNLDLRHYAERTIQQETPAHLLGKTCWVGDDGYVENICDDIIDQLADLLVSEGMTAGATPPESDDACSCALAIYQAFSTAFAGWYADKKFAFLHADALQTLITAQFQNVPMFSDGTCTTVFTAALWDKIRVQMTAYFVGIALYGWQFERFEWVWRQWLAANAAIDWTEERLVERVEAILVANVQTPSATAAALCACAQQIVTDYGNAFYAWMQSNVTAGNAVDKLTAFTKPAVTLCLNMSFSADTETTISALLSERYACYVKPSYWLWAVVTLLAGLRNTYPGATLHDCDSSSDQNPVRLDNTALGYYPRRTTL